MRRCSHSATLSTKPAATATVTDSNAHSEPNCVTELVGVAGRSTAYRASDEPTGRINRSPGALVPVAVPLPAGMAGPCLARPQQRTAPPPPTLLDRLKP